MSSTPPDWRRLRFGEFAHVEHGWPFKSSEYTTAPGLPIVVSIGNFEYTGGFRFDRSTVKRYAGEYPIAFELNPGDLLLVMTCQTEGGEILGVPGRVPDDGQRYLHNQRIGRVIIDRPEMVVPDFLFHLARWTEFNRQLVVTASGSKILHTSPDRIAATVVGLPPVEEQKAIASALTALDDKIAANTRLAGKANALAQAIFDHTAREADLQSMTKTLTPVLGGTPPRNRAQFWQGEVPWASARDVADADFGVILGTEERISDLAARETRARPLPRGSIILTARGTVGAVARLGVPSSFNQSCYGFVPGALPPGVLYFSVLSAAERARELAHGSVFDTITTRTFQHLVIPAFRNQQASDLETRITPLLDLVESVARERRALAATRDALLPALMSGRLRVSDAAE